MSEHALNRIVGRIMQGRLKNFDVILKMLTEGKDYVEPDGTLVKYLDNISIHLTPKERIV